MKRLWCWYVHRAYNRIIIHDKAEISFICDKCGSKWVFSTRVGRWI